MLLARLASAGNPPTANAQGVAATYALAPLTVPLRLRNGASKKDIGVVEATINALLDDEADFFSADMPDEDLLQWCIHTADVMKVATGATFVRNADGLPTLFSPTDSPSHDVPFAISRTLIRAMLSCEGGARQLRRLPVSGTSRRRARWTHSRGSVWTSLGGCGPS